MNGLKKIRIILAFFRICLTDGKFLLSFTGNLLTFAGLSLQSLLLKKKFILLSLTEHIGDIVAAEPISRFIRKNNPDALICWIIEKKYKPLETNNPVINKIITVSCFSEWIFLRYFLSKKKYFDLHINGKVCGKHGFQYVDHINKEITIENYLDKGNLLYCFSRSAHIDIDYKIAPLLHLDLSKLNFQIARAYLVCHTSTNTSEKNWTPANWTKLASYVLNNYPSFSVLEVGTDKQIELNDDRYIDKTGEKEFAEIASLINKCTLFIGLDSGFSHFANALNKEALILIGKFNNFVGYMPYSGKYFEEAERQILYSNDHLSYLDIEIVKAKLDQKLQSLF